jgi:hypothetical protein
MIEWAKKINDDNLHHIGEYYTYRYKKPWVKKNGEYTKSFYNWLIWQNTNEFERMFIRNNFEILRDNRSFGFYIKCKSVNKE